MTIAASSLFLVGTLCAAGSPAAQQWSTYLGGSSHERAARHALAVTRSGDVVLGGQTASADFPLQNALQTFRGGPTWGDGWIACLAGDGRSLRWSTYLGGSADDEVRGVAIAPNGDVLVCGYTASPDFPATAIAGAPYQARLAGGGDAFVARFAWDGSTLAMLWATYLGAGGIDTADAIAVLPSGEVVVAGGTGSSDFPVSDGAYQPRFGGGLDGFVALLSVDGTRLLAATFIGGAGVDLLSDLDVDGRGQVAVVGLTDSAGFPAGALRHGPLGQNDVCVLVLDPGLTGSVAAVRIGATGRDDPYALVATPAGHLGIAGWTGSPSFPTTTGPAYAGGPFDGFVTLIDPRSGALVWSRLFGGPAAEGVHDLVVDSAGLVTIVGETSGSDLSLTGVYHPGPQGGVSDGFVARLDPAARIADVLYARHLGGAGDDRAYALAVPPGGGGAVHVAGSAGAGFPTTPRAFDPSYNGDSSDAFVAALELLPIGVDRNGMPTGGCRPVESGLAGFRGTCYPDPNGFGCLQPFPVEPFATGAPPGAAGACIVGFHLARPPVQIVGVELLIAPPLVAEPVRADAFGFASIPVQLMYWPPGRNGVALQWAFVTNPACPGTGPVAASAALTF